MDFSVLKGLELVKTGRASDMLWMSIGEPLVVTGRGGQKRVVSRYAFHVRCPWRFMQSRKIILGSGNSHGARKIALASDPCWDWDNYMNDAMLPLAVTDVTAFQNGDLRLTFKKDVTFELFIPGSQECEYWRFIDFERDLHHVVYEE